jgi:prolipoprotein diacylglyceryltransferase
MFDTLNGALLCAFLGAVLGTLIGGTIWYIMGGPFASEPSILDVIYGTRIGMIEGALFGALLAMFDCVRNHQARQSQPKP